MKKALIACLIAVMMVGFSASALAALPDGQYSNKWDGSHTRDWVGAYEDGDGCIDLGNNPWSIHNRHLGNNPHKLAALWWLWTNHECGLNPGHSDE